MSYIKIPILRGFTEISILFDAIKNNGYICGGYARYCCSQAKEPIKAADIDIFPTNHGDYDILRNKFMNEIGLTVKHENTVSISFLTPGVVVNEEGTPIENSIDIRWQFVPQIQLIKPVLEGHIVTVGTIENILDNFDFSITRAAIISSTECLVDPDFEHDEINHILRLKNIHCPISSLLRCLKYCKKGYWLRPFEALKLFRDWDDRGEDYKNNLINLFEKSFSKNEDGETIKMEKRDIDELEKLLKVD